MNKIGLETRKVCEMILFIGGPVDWKVGVGMGDMDGGEVA